MPLWCPLGPAPQDTGGVKVSGRVWSVVVSPDVDGFGRSAIFIGTDGGGIWRTYDLSSASPVWIPVSDRLAVATEVKPALQSINALAVSPAAPRTLYASAPGGVLRSVDGGLHWLLASRQPFLSSLAPDPTDAAGQRLWACSTDGIFLSTDAGGTWVPRSNGLPTPRNV